MKLIDKDLLQKIYLEIANNDNTTEVLLAEKYYCSERTIRRYIKILKDNKYITMVGTGTKRKWIILK